MIYTKNCVKESGFQLFHIWEDSVEDDLFGIIEILDEI